ncbi:MAG: histidine kinase, partial [Proteobacteria bacterium]|nr:histidine kinase [Pseudomonadota bacterium]
MTISDLLNFYSPRLASTNDLALILDQTGEVLYTNEAVRNIQSAPFRSYAPQDIIEQLQAEVRSKEFSSLPKN